MPHARLGKVFAPPCDRAGHCAAPDVCNAAAVVKHPVAGAYDERHLHGFFGHYEPVFGVGGLVSGCPGLVEVGLPFVCLRLFLRCSGVRAKGLEFSLSLCECEQLPLEGRLRLWGGWW